MVPRRPNEWRLIPTEKREWFTHEILQCYGVLVATDGLAGIIVARDGKTYPVILTWLHGRDNKRYVNEESSVRALEEKRKQHTAAVLALAQELLK